MSRGISINYANSLNNLRNLLLLKTSLKSNAVDLISCFLDLTSENLVQKIVQLEHMNKKSTITDKTVETSVKLLLPPELRKIAVAESSRAVHRFIKYCEQEQKNKQEDQKSSRKQRSIKAGLVFSVSKCTNLLRKTKLRVSPFASVFLAATLQYLASELLTNADAVTTSQKRIQITAHDVLTGVFGTRQFIHEYLLSKKSKAKASQQVDENVFGDEELKVLADKLHWGVLVRGIKGMYTKPKRRRKATGVVVKSSESLVDDPAVKCDFGTIKKTSLSPPQVNDADVVMSI